VSNDLEDLTRVEPRRDRYGRPLILPKGGGERVAMTRMSSLGAVMSNTFNLEKWKLRQVALGLAARPDLVSRAALAQDDKRALDALVEEAMEAAGANIGREWGSTMHSVIEMHLKGQDVPSLFAEQIAAFERCRELHGIEFDCDNIERFVVNEALNAAGSFDYRARINGVDMIGDLKTGKSLSEGEIAFQLGGYATANSYYDWSDDTHRDPEPVDQERAFVLHMPKDEPGTCTLKWVDLRPAIQAFDHVVFAHKWRNRKGFITTAEAPADGKPKARRKAAGKPKRGNGSVEAAETAVPKRTLEPVPMPDLPEATEAAARANARPAPMPRLHPSEGDLVAVELVHELRDRALASDEEPTIRRWVQESRDAHCDYSMGRGLHSERRFLISSASVTLAEGGDGDEWARAVLAVVLGDDAHKLSVPVGQLLGTLTREQAVKVDELARTAVAHYDDAGRLQVVPA
jgi:hypothetical protein